MKVILTEKPSVARDLASVLGATKKKDGYIEGNNFCITWAFGHLVELVEPEDYDPAFKSWNLPSLPIVPESFKLRVSSAKGVKKQFNIIKSLFKAAEGLVCATDAGREGELIFRYIQQKCGCVSKPAQRLWISSMTDEAIKEGFAKLKPLSEYDNLAAAATCRSQADWIVGLNSTRGYTVQHSHGRGVLSVGRVQTPVLALIVKRDLEIRNFKPEDYWELWTVYRDVKFKHETDRFTKKEDAEALGDKIKDAPFEIVSIKEKSTSQAPPLLFDLTELQRTMNRLYSFSATRTLEIAQNLYEGKAISYPRTDSRYLSEDLHKQSRDVLGKLSANYASMIQPLDPNNLSKSKRIFNSKKVTDHHAIIPTGKLPNSLGRDEQLVFDAIVKRFIAVFYPNCEKAHTTILGESLGEKFKAKGTRIVKAGWFELYKSEKKDKKDEEQILPSFEKGETGPHKPDIKKCTTKPPHTYNEGSLLTAMETAGKVVEDEELKEAMKEKGLGTPATRASIIETLLKREYIRKEKKALRATEKGEELIRLLQHQATLTSPSMTAEWEHRLKQIEKGEAQAVEFMQQVREFTKHIIQTLKSEAEKGISDFGPCPLCKSPIMKGNTGYGCSAWKTGCPFRFHADQFGVQLKDKDVQAMMYRGRTQFPRKLKDAEGNDCRGYVTIDAEGKLGIKTYDSKVAEDSLGDCPQCGGAVAERQKCYSCCDCEFVIWKKVARRDISKTVAKALMTQGRSQYLKGFKSKAGKDFACALVLKDGKVSFDFSAPPPEKAPS